MGIEESIKESEGSLLIDIEVMPGAGQNAVVGYDRWRRRIKVKVKAEAQKDKANIAIVDFFSSLCGVGASEVEIVSGARNRQKRVRIYGVNKARLLDMLGGSP